MANKYPLILISSSGEDVRFAKGLAETAGLDLLGFSKVEDGAKAFFDMSDRQAIALVDVTTQGHLQLFTQAMAAESKARVAAPVSNRIVLMGNHTLLEAPYLAGSPLFGTYFQRNFGAWQPEPSALFARHLDRLLKKNEFGLRNFLGADVSVKEVALPDSQNRTIIADAIQKASEAGGFRRRISDRVATAVDELLMNAIFDAPVDENGTRIYRLLPRTAEFTLEGKSSVRFSIAFDGEVLGISVRDNYGSLEKVKFLQNLSMAGTNKDSITSASRAGAGLGLATIYSAGCDMFFHCQKGQATEVILLFRNAPSAMESRSEFRMLGTYFC